ncbi:hypothetical protein Plim_3766 [Planctopirus limnophila DSM 3776]|uniref:Uncharacterized protein n=1 Tax=Planctopirus limnophila (strain ATCC 43296 / DSM 3776 / IFAM 1008 / Mu 290) TaxID=521674 RepID=D5SWI5_PLAL2|nr:DoxX family protein [Planctopirus limnophila]ADG69578.1 hypothetical protein Plim_3766 [Planctopirus limnophila DSM 3776]
MNGEDRKISQLACVLLVTLRLFIGWHLLYEGWWKIDTQKSPQPWSAEGYLKNATGPLRGFFRSLLGDPNDLRWVNYDYMSNKWDDYANRFLAHYNIADDAPEAGRLMYLLNGPAQFSAKLEALPPGVTQEKMGRLAQFDPAKKILSVDGKQHLLAAERDRLLSLVDASAADTPPAVAYKNAVNSLYNQGTRLSYKERLAVLLKGDPERVGVIQREKDGKEIEKRIGDIELYQAQIERYEANHAQAKTKYQWDHLETQWRELQDLRRRVVGPVQALEQELRDSAEKLLSSDQLAMGPVPQPWTEGRVLSWRTMWSLTIFGFLLIIGLGTRFAAVGGAGLLMLFYLAAPPWPGTPEAPGIEHNYIVNKVNMEALTLLAIAAMPTGRWFGLDGLIYSFWKSRQKSRD